MVSWFQESHPTGGIQVPQEFNILFNKDSENGQWTNYLFASGVKDRAKNTDIATFP